MCRNVTNESAMAGTIESVIEPTIHLASGIPTLCRSARMPGSIEPSMAWPRARLATVMPSCEAER